MLLDADESQLLLVDYQSRLMPFIHEGELVIANALRLGRLAQLFEVPAWGTEENPASLGENPAPLRALCRKTLAKMHFDALEDGLVPLLRAPARVQPGGNARSLPRHLQKAPPAQQPERNAIVIAGCEAHVCLLQTALGLLRAGHRAWVVAPACASRRAEDRALAMQRLRQAGAAIVSVEMVVFEWLRGCRHEHFRPTLQLLKTPRA